MNDNNSSTGRGWYGDSEGHANAGRKGGQARSRNSSSNSKKKGETQKSDKSEITPDETGGTL